MSTTIKQAIDGFLLTCKVEGKSYGTIDCYSDKLKGFLWYASNHDWPDDIRAITTNHLREFLAYLRETPHRFNSTCPRAMKLINSTTIQKYYRALSALFNWSINEGILETNPLVKIKVPRAEKKDEQRAAIRARLLAGQEAARKRRRNEHKVKRETSTVPTSAAKC